MMLDPGHDDPLSVTSERSGAEKPIASSPRTITIGLVVFYAVETFIVAAILLIVGLSVALTAFVIAAKVGLTALSLWAIVRLAWAPTARGFPPMQIGMGAVSRSMQSIAFGSFARWNNCVTVTVDEDYLHLHPLPLFAWFGAEQISIPFDEIKIVKSGTWQDVLHATVGTHRLIGPAWCLELAREERTSPERDTRGEI